MGWLMGWLMGWAGFVWFDLALDGFAWLWMGCANVTLEHSRFTSQITAQITTQITHLLFTEPWVHHVVNAVNRQRRLCDVGGDDDLGVGLGLGLGWGGVGVWGLKGVLIGIA